MKAEILIIDDNSDIRVILNELIQDAGYKTRLAANYNKEVQEDVPIFIEVLKRKEDLDEETLS